MRLRCSGTNLNRPRRVIIGRIYEKFKPIFEWRQEDDHYSLLVYLPGFRKEFIKVTTEGHNILRIRGERLVNGNKWDRFHEDFTVPETCKKSGICAKFDGGILIVTMPKKNTTIATHHKHGDPMKTAKQATDSAKPSSLTLNATLPPQPPAANGGADQGKTEQKPLDRNKGKEPLIENIRKTKTGSDSKLKDKLEGHMQVVKRLAMGGMKEGRMVAVLVVLVVAAAVGVYVSYFIGAPIKQHIIEKFVNVFCVCVCESDATAV